VFVPIAIGKGELKMSEPSIRLYHAEWCPSCHPVRRKLTDLGISYVTINVLPEKSMREDLFRVSGQRGIPALVDGDIIIADDDAAIIAYRDGRYGKTALRAGG
jgi:glutathione S-transferase